MNTTIYPLLCLLVLGTIPLQAATPKLGPNAAKLEAYLPNGTPLAKASCEDIARAIAAAAEADPDNAPTLLPEIITYLRAINPNGMAEEEQPGQKKPRYYPTEQCVRNFLRAAIDGAPKMSSEIIETLLAAYPEYGPVVGEVLNVGGGGGLFGPGGVGPGFSNSPTGVGGQPDVSAPDDDPVTPDQPR